MAKNLDLNALSLVELREIESNLPAIIKGKVAAEKAAVTAELKKLAAEKGFELNDLFGASEGGKKARTPAAVKYRHPENADLTWTGRGRQPKWVESILSTGKTLDDLKV